MSKLEDLIDKHQGSIGFICGAGPSLRHLNNSDIDILKKNVVIAVNSALPKVPFCQYFLADDIGVKNWDYYVHLLPKLDCQSLLYKDKLEDHANHLDLDKVIFFRHKWWNDPKNKKRNPEGLVLTKGEPIIGARTAAGSAVHFAYLMGCNPIVLLGCDCSYDGMRRYYWQFEGETECKRITGEPVFSFPNRGKQNGKYIDAHCVSFIEYWSELSKQTKKQNIEVLNASEGLLDCFPKVSVGDFE